MKRKYKKLSKLVLRDIINAQSRGASNSNGLGHFYITFGDVKDYQFINCDRSIKLVVISEGPFSRCESVTIEYNAYRFATRDDFTLEQVLAKPGYVFSLKLNKNLPEEVELWMRLNGHL